MTTPDDKSGPASTKLYLFAGIAFLFAGVVFLLTGTNGIWVAMFSLGLVFITLSFTQRKKPTGDDGA